MPLDVTPISIGFSFALTIWFVASALGWVWGYFKSIAGHSARKGGEI